MSKVLRNRRRSVFGFGDQAGSGQESVRHKDRYLRQRVDSRLRCSRPGGGSLVPSDLICQLHDLAVAGSTTVQVRSQEIQCKLRLLEHFGGKLPNVGTDLL